MRKIYLLIQLNLVCLMASAQNFEWAKREGLWAYDYGYGISTDNNGNVYVAGKYEENANFSGIILPSSGNHDIFISQYSPSGTLNWIRTGGGIYGDYAHCLSCDGSSNVYIAGEIEGDYSTLITFPGSAITLNCKGDNDVFVAKYNLSGTLIWAKRAGGNHSDKALGVTSDSAGNVYICGLFTDTATFGNTTIYGQGGKDLFIAKYDVNGNFVWVRQAGSSGREEAKSIKCDRDGNVYVCGMYSNGCVFGNQTLTSPNGYFNSFLAKYAPDGTLNWVKTGGGDYDDVAWALTISNDGKIFITGEFNAYALFGSYHITTSGNADIFVACYDSSGNVQWVTKAGGALIDRARGIGCDGINIYITGQFGLSANFGSYSVAGVDSSEIFMTKLNHEGVFQWVKSVDGPPDPYESLGYECGQAICSEPDRNVYATGTLLNGGVFGTTSFDPYGRTDVFITKISQNNSPAATFNQTFNLCPGHGVTVGSHTYNSNGNYTDIFSSYLNYDSLVTTYLTIVPVNIFSQSKTICAGQNLIVGSHTYTASGNYTDVLASYLGCDSTINTHLIVWPVSANSQTKIICGGQNFNVGPHTYTASGNYVDVLTSYQGCDSTVTTHLTVLPAPAFSQMKTICAGHSFTVGSHAYTTSGNYTDTLLSYQGCDSIVITHLTVLPALTFSQTKIICAGHSFTVGSHTYTTSGIYTDVLTSYQNCDSTVTTHLTVIQALTFSQTKIICAGHALTVGSNTYGATGNYLDVLTSLLNGCDSIVTTHLTVLPLITFAQKKVVCKGQTLTVGSNTYGASGHYTDNLTSLINGCDSVVATSLTVDSVDTSISVSTLTLKANTSNAAYQWINCSNADAPIAGQINQTFTPTSNGNYAVIVTQNNCTDTSSCHPISFIGIDEFDFAGIVNVYPNPNTGIFTLEYCFDNIKEKTMTIEIFNSIGKSIYQKQLINKNGCFKETIEMDPLAVDFIILKITAGKLVESRKLLLVK